jgi:hypothetical protein
VTTTQTSKGGEAKAMNGKGVYKSPSGLTCYMGPAFLMALVTITSKSSTSSVASAGSRWSLTNGSNL